MRDFLLILTATLMVIAPVFAQGLNSSSCVCSEHAEAGIVAVSECSAGATDSCCPGDVPPAPVHEHSDDEVPTDEDDQGGCCDPDCPKPCCKHSSSASSALPPRAKISLAPASSGTWKTARMNVPPSALLQGLEEPPKANALGVPAGACVARPL